MSTEVIESGQEVAERVSSLSLITNDGYMSRVMDMARLMASSKVTVPKHLQGSEGDCAAIVIQSTNWGMNPFAVAQKTHLVNGVLGYEAQLVNAVIMASNAIKGNFKYEYKGDGNNMECRVGAVINGENEITWGEWLKVSDVTTKNSPLWKTNPKQQMGYLQVKNWARLFCPGSILGVYTADELEAPAAGEKDITSETVIEKPTLPAYPDEQFRNNIGTWQTAVNDGRSPESIVNKISTRYQLTKEQADKILGLTKEVVVNDFVADMERAEGEDHANA